MGRPAKGLPTFFFAPDRFVMIPMLNFKLFVFIFASLALFVPQTRAQLVSPPEDLHALAVKRAEFAPPAPIDAGTQSQPGFTRQLLQVQWRIGDPIDLYIVRPEKAVKPPVVLFLYSWPDDTDRFRSDDWCRNITQHGFAAVGFVSALTGHRYHNRAWKETFVSELPEAVVKTAHDVQLLLDYLATRPDLDMTRAGIFGQGSGGTIALLSASVEPRLKAIDVIDPWGDWPDWFQTSPVIPDSERAHFVDPTFLKPLAIVDPISILPALNPQTVRLQQTTLNPSTPLVAREALHRALPAGAAYTLYQGEEDYRARAMKDTKILDWLKSKLTTP